MTAKRDSAAKAKPDPNAPGSAYEQRATGPTFFSDMGGKDAVGVGEGN